MTNGWPATLRVAVEELDVRRHGRQRNDAVFVEALAAVGAGDTRRGSHRPVGGIGSYVLGGGRRAAARELGRDASSTVDSRLVTPRRSR